LSITVCSRGTYCLSLFQFVLKERTVSLYSSLFTRNVLILSITVCSRGTYCLSLLQFVL
ncbi:hypothetical protein LOTGIDRAFT_109244, partial [Lottia gigantea]